MSEKSEALPQALYAPDADVVPLTLSMVGELLKLSKESERKRMIQRIHKRDDVAVHKMFNALQPGTYIPPHRHLDPAKTETVLVVAGSMLFVRFTEDGDIEDQILVQPGTETFGVDVAPHVYHTFIALKPDTLIFEVKDGPYVKASDKDFPAWAPKEGAPEADAYLLNLLKTLAENANAADQSDPQD